MLQLLAGGTQFVHCREVVRSSECPLLEVPLYIYMYQMVLEGFTKSVGDLSLSIASIDLPPTEGVRSHPSCRQ